MWGGPGPGQFNNPNSNPPQPNGNMQGSMMPGIKPVGIFWDIENCPVQKGKVGSGVISFIRNFFIVNRLSHREFEFLVACDVTRLKKELAEDINRAGGVTLAHVNGNSKNAADEKIRESMKRFVDTHASSNPVIVLISGDIDFVNDLRAYQTRLGCSVIVVHGGSCSQHFKTGWNEVYAFDNFMRMMEDPTPTGAVTGQANNAGTGKPWKQVPAGSFHPGTQGPSHPKPKEKGKTAESGGNKVSRQQAQQQYKKPGFAPVPAKHAAGSVGNPSELPDMNKLSLKEGQAERPKFILMVVGLPGKMDFKILKEHLQEEADGVGGKVKFVKNGQGFISFKSKRDADKAIALFNGMEVYGKKLNVQYVKSIPFETSGSPKKAHKAESNNSREHDPPVNPERASEVSHAPPRFAERTGFAQIRAVNPERHVPPRFVARTGFAHMRPVNPERVGGAHALPRFSERTGFAQMRPVQPTMPAGNGNRPMQALLNEFTAGVVKEVGEFVRQNQEQTGPSSSRGKPKKKDPNCCIQ